MYESEYEDEPEPFRADTMKLKTEMFRTSLKLGGDSYSNNQPILSVQNRILEETMSSKSKVNKRKREFEWQNNAQSSVFSNEETKSFIDSLKNK